MTIARKHYNYGIDLVSGGKTLRLFFTDAEDWAGDDDYSEIVVGKDGNEYCITYTAPDLDQWDDECESDFSQRRVDAIDWSDPYLIERLDTGELLYDAGDPHGVTVRWFDE